MKPISLRSIRAVWIAGAILVGCGGPGFTAPDARADGGGSDGNAMLDGNDAARTDAIDRTAADTMDVGPSQDVRDVPFTNDTSDSTPNADAVDVRAGCRSDGDCATGRVCCAATGACYDPSCLACCMFTLDAGGSDGSTSGSCTSNFECGSSEYCAGTGCGTPGTCAALPIGCSRIFDPVCGCDGVDYSNECVANGAGTRADYHGTCGTAVDAGSPGSCLTNSECGAREFCDAHACATPGTCSPRPDLCSAIYDPVCGCDGVTYSNSCTANAAGARVAATGTCGGAVDAGRVDSGPGGCIDNSMCARTQFCSGTGCDTDGTCVPRPDACIDLYNPVCGCDGTTYSNSCFAASAGVRVASTGACTMGSVDAGIDRCATVRCRSGYACCPSTGACYDTRCLACCMPRL
jgi:hypothetical protein